MNRRIVLIISDVFYSWVANQHETTENNNTSTTIPKLQPSSTSSDATTDREQATYSETAIQVNSDLFACSQLKATKRTLEWQQGTSDHNDAIKKEGKHKSIPQPSSLT